MQAEFVNVFLEKQRDHLIDFVSRVIMAETKQHFADKEIEDLTAKLTAAEGVIANLEKEKDSLKEQVSAGEQHDKKRDGVIDRLNIDIGDLKNEIIRLNESIVEKEQDIFAKQNEITKLISDKNSMTHLVEEGLSIKSQLRTVTAELEHAKKREQSMIADYQNLSAEYEQLKTKYKEAILPAQVPAKTGKGVNTPKK